MLAKTAGIVIRNTRYGEGSLISKIYTRQFGIQSYMVNGVYGAKASIKASVLQPLSLLEMVVYHNRLKEIQRIKEAKTIPALNNIHFDVVKSSICMFVSELLAKTLKEEEPNERLYDFIAGFVERLDAETGNLALWPLFFMIQLTRYLGFYPDNNFSEAENNSFDLAEGHFTAFPKRRELVINMPESGYFSQIIGLPLSQAVVLHLPKPVRATLLRHLINYYKLHMPEFQDIRSLEVLEALA